MELKPHLEKAWSSLAADLPLCQNTVIVVGRSAGKEALKDVLLLKAPRGILPGTSVLTLIELAKRLLQTYSTVAGAEEALNSSGFTAPLLPVDQADALQMIAATARGTPWAKHFRNRRYATKVASFISALDRHAHNDEEKEALLEAAAEQNPHLSPVYDRLKALWAQGVLTPWSDAEVFRQIINVLRTSEPSTIELSGLPQQIWLYETFGLSPLEKSFIHELSRHFQVELEEPLEFSAIDEIAVSSKLEFWTPHSVWDEIQQLKQSLLNLIKQHGDQVLLKTAVFVPNQSIYKRLVRDELLHSRIPLRDPSLPKAWVDKPEWIWWRDALRAVSSGLDRDSVISLLGPGKNKEDQQAHMLFVEQTAKKGIAGRLKDMESVLKTNDLPLLRALVLTAKSFAKSFTVQDLSKVVGTLSIDLAPYIEQGVLPSLTLLQEFSNTLLGREYLRSTKFRLPKLIPLFEEYLETKSLEQSLRAEKGGVWFLSHGVNTPVALEYAFILGAHAIDPMSTSTDPLTVETVVESSKDSKEGSRARILWQMLNSEYEPDRIREERITTQRRAILGTKTIIVSQPTYDIDAKPTPSTHWPKVILGDNLFSSGQSTFSAAHPLVNWTKGLEFNTEAPIVSDASSGERIQNTKRIRVSAFEDYLVCPFIYYARHELKLDHELEIGVDVKPQDKGTVLHKVAERVLRYEIEHGQLPSQSTMKDLLQTEVKARSFQGMYRAPLLKNKVSSQLEHLLTGWLSHESQRRIDYPTLKPWLLEESIEFELTPELTLSGRVDRLDLDQEKNVFIVIDYKTGTPSFSGKELKEGAGVQLLSYGLAISNKYNASLAGAFYMELKNTILERTGVYIKEYAGSHHKATGRSGGFVKEGSFTDLMPPILENWQKAAQELQKGNFTPKPAKSSTCTRCAFQHACGYPIHLSQDVEHE